MTTRFNNDDSQSRRSTPPVPPGFEAQDASRSSTPVAPPGLTGRSTTNPDLKGAESRSSSRTGFDRSASGQTHPITPLRPATPRLASKLGTSTSKEIVAGHNLLEQETSAKQSISKASDSASDNIQGGPREEGQSGRSTKQHEDVDRKSAPLDSTTLLNETRKEGAVHLSHPVVGEDGKADPRGPDAKRTSAKAGMQREGQSEPPNKAGRRADKGNRQHPGKLDIASAVQEQEKASRAEASSATPTESSETSLKVQRNQLRSAVDQEESPGALPPGTKAAPRTLRLVQTPKSELPPTNSSSAHPNLPTPALEKFKQPSRQPSVASIQLPGTPSSEHVSISDTVSLTSTSQSRANSPPPPTLSKIGTAPVRTKTKSQVKKERQERAQEKAKDTEDPKPASAEPQQEAILSRKKKTRKEKEPKPPKPKTVPAPVVTKAEPDAKPDVGKPESPRDKQLLNNKPSTEQPRTSPTTAELEASLPSTKVVGPSPPLTPTMTAASLIAELKASAPEIQKCIESLFRIPGAQPLKPAHPITAKDLASNPANWKSDHKLNLTKDEVEALLTGKAPAIRYGGEDGRTWDRGMITPAGAHLRALTEELETRYLELEKAIRSLPDELRFHATKPQNDTKFPSVDLEMLRRQFESISSRMPSVMEQIMQENSSTTMSAHSKRNAFLVDEASKYINEFVMPPATPPPSAGGVRSTVQNAASSTMQGVPMPEQNIPHLSLEVIERQLAEARRAAEGHEQQLRKQVKKVKKMSGC